MVGNYPIMYNGQRVGNAQIEREGLHLRIFCQCRVVIGKRSRLTLRSNEAEKDLGLCASDSGFAEIRVRISGKEAGDPPYSFRLDEEKKESFLPVFVDRPFPALRSLKEARLAICDGIVGVSLREL